jgi:phage gpG-like protein
VVGYLEGETATYAAANEFGVSGRIPARPFMRPTVDANAQKYGEMLGASARQQMLNNGRMSSALLVVGNAMRNDIIKAIVALRNPPNAPATIAKKGSSNPLVDTGNMQRQLVYEIRRG